MSVTPAFERSELLARAGFSHGFFERSGGVSEGPFASLNFSTASGDLPERVAENFRRAAEVLGVASEAVYCLSQVHGTRARLLTGEEQREAVLLEEGDITLSGAPGVACGTRYADCVPVLLADPQSGAVAAVHAGWRGVAANAVAAGVTALGALVGRPLQLLAAVGPHISASAFEVSEDVAQQLERASNAAGVVLRSGPQPKVALRRIVHAQLLMAGLREEHIEHLGGCTVSEPERYHSFRRDGAASGRHLAAIVARPAGCSVQG